MVHEDDDAAVQLDQTQAGPLERQQWRSLLGRGPWRRRLGLHSSSARSNEVVVGCFVLFCFVRVGVGHGFGQRCNT